ncbi:10338_t:CDS:1 [Ambispora leptoticha]|uniref:10338_t:CDS:1 n=1 Tax=Ambispora leptoticha TaxID=144679 RepID=A0A9N8VYX4_9GLOM|nr:10338_t:CDS:1 [Ambispora leptoticha]
MDPRFSADLMIDFHSWFSSSETELPTLLLERIFLIFFPAQPGQYLVQQSQQLISGLIQFTIEERSSTRSIIYNRIKGMSDFVDGSQSELIRRSENKKRIKILEKDLEQRKQLHRNELLNARDEIEKEYRQKLESEKQRCNLENQQLNDKFNREKESMELEHQKVIQNLRDKIQKLEDENKKSLAKIKDLQTEKDAAVKEAIVLQIALGDVRNVQWSDDDPNDPEQLIKDIGRIQKSLTDVTKVKGKQIQINEAKTNGLFDEYKIETHDEAHDAKTALSLSLQRLIFKKVYEFIENLSSINEDDNLESSIISTTKELVCFMEEFEATRSGDDDITRFTPIKIRQHVYASLGSRSFNDPSHPIIIAITNDLLNEMNKYREMLSEEDKNRLNVQLAELVIELIRFLFRLSTQEPKLDVKWVKRGKKIRNELMQGPWDSGDSDNLVVNFCYFPAIGINLSDKKNLRIYCKAQVLAKSYSRFSSFVRGVIDAVSEKNDS